MKTSVLEIGMQALHEHVPFVDYTDGDVVIIDNVRELSEVSPIKADMNIILLCQQGRLQCDMNSRPILLEAGQVLLAPPNVVLGNYMFSPDFECKILCLSKAVIQGLLRDEISVWNQTVYVRNTNVLTLTDDMRTLFGYYHALILSRLQSDTGFHRRDIMQALVRALLLELCGLLRDSAQHSATPVGLSQGKILFNRFLAMLQDARQKRQPVGHYASQLAVTPKYLTMICEKYSGKAASAWIDQYVMEDVRYHLCETTMSVKEIASRLGFANISHFGTYVRRHTGQSPRTFREAALKGQ